MVKSKISLGESYEEEYFSWLCGLVATKQQARIYSKLLWSLFKKAFYGFLPHDDNREKDGEKLRETFLDTTGLNDTSYLKGKCSVLEMIIALSYRADYIVTGLSDGPAQDKWFWIMIKNLKLDQYKGEFSERDHNEIDKKLNKLIDRRYSFSGKGGLFPLRNPKANQREIEIWYQMMAYIEENEKL